METTQIPCPRCGKYIYAQKDNHFLTPSQSCKFCKSMIS